MAFNGRRGPNITQFLRELHENPSLVDTDPAFSLEDHDYSMFTNTEFYDFETGQNTDFQPQQPLHPGKPTTATPASSAGSEAVTPVTDEAVPSALEDFNTGLDFIAGDFNFPDFHAGAYTSPSIPSFQDGLNLQPIQQGGQSVYPHPTHGSHSHHSGPTAPNGAASSQPRLAAADKRKPDILNPITTSVPSRHLSFEDQTRHAAEEDKRRRNTAASARFRIKKKQREQALEKSARDMSDKVSALENRISQLETENKWLKGIVLEKNAGNEEFLTKLLDDFKSKHGSGQANRSSNGSEADVAAVSISDEENETRDSSG